MMTSLVVKGIVFRNQAVGFLNNQIAKIKSNDSGVTAVEYALIIGLIAIVIIGAVTLLGSSVSDLFTKARCAIVNGTFTEGTSTAAATCSK